MNFLNVPQDNRKFFPIINSNTVHRYPLLGAFYVNTPPYISFSVRVVKKIFHIEDFGVSKKLIEIDKVAKRRSPLNPKMWQHLLDTFREDILLLSKRTGKDLSKWLIKPAN